MPPVAAKSSARIITSARSQRPFWPTILFLHSIVRSMNDMCGLFSAHVPNARCTADSMFLHVSRDTKPSSDPWLDPSSGKRGSIEEQKSGCNAYEMPPPRDDDSPGVKVAPHRRTRLFRSSPLAGQSIDGSFTSCARLYATPLRVPRGQTVESTHASAGASSITPAKYAITADGRLAIFWKSAQQSTPTQRCKKSVV